MSFLRPVVRAMLVAVIAGGLVWTGPVLGRTDPVDEAWRLASLDEDEPDPSPSPSPAPAGSVDPSASPEREPTATPEPGATASPAPAPSANPDPTATADASATPPPSANPDPTATPPPPAPIGWTGRYNLFRPSAWVPQYWSHTCTAASTQTMLNLITQRDDRTRITQDRIIRYARTHDTLVGSRGSDPLGWANALTRFGAGTYRWRVFSSRASALRYAALRILNTRKPVGLLVWQGRHAWTMTGFTAKADPRTSTTVAISGIYVAPPLVGTDPAPNTWLPTSSLGTFARYRERDGFRTWVNRWVVVAP